MAHTSYVSFPSWGRAYDALMGLGLSPMGSEADCPVQIVPFRPNLEGYPKSDKGLVVFGQLNADGSVVFDNLGVPELEPFRDRVRRAVESRRSV